MSRNATYRRLIHSKQWRELRARKMARNPMCEDCAAAGRSTLATEVHHVLPIEGAADVREMERRAFDWHNLRSLCPACHQKAHEMLHSKSKQKQKERAELEAERFRARWL